MLIEQSLRFAIDSVNPDRFLQRLSAIDQEKHKSKIPSLELPKFNWIFENIDFKQWKSTNGHVLWLSGPPTCRIDQAVSHIVDQAKADSGSQNALLYIFCRTVANATSVGTGFVRVLLHQLVSNLLPPKKKSVITVFLHDLLDAVISKKDTDLDSKLWPVQDITKQLLCVTRSSEHWEALMAALKIEERELVLIIDGLDDCRHELTREICAFVSQLRGRVKALLTSRPQNVIKVMVEEEGVLSIEYDKERQGTIITPLLCANLTRQKTQNVLIPYASKTPVTTKSRVAMWAPYIGFGAMISIKTGPPLTALAYYVYKESLEAEKVLS